jgi:hypothetical protein
MRVHYWHIEHSSMLIRVMILLVHFHLRLRRALQVVMLSLALLV